MALSVLVGLTSWWMPTSATTVLAQADTPPTDTYIRSDNTLYAYVEAGESLDISFTKVAEEPNGTDTTITVTDPTGASQTCDLATGAAVGEACDFTDLTSDTTGIWQVRSHPKAFPGDRLSWDITVQDGGSVKSGRVWSTSYNMRNEAPVDLTVYYLNQQGFLYQADYSGYNGVDSNLAVDSVGNTFDGTCTSAYKSYDFGTTADGFPYGDEDTYDTTRLRDPGSCGDVYKIFFDEPSADLPATGTMPDGSTTWVRPALVLPKINSLDFDETGTDERSGTFTAEVQDFTGQLVIQIDADGNGSYDDPIDRQFQVGTADGTATVDFDGLDGNGDPIDTATDIAARAVIDQAGEIHFVNWDVEQRSGIQVTALNGPQTGSTTLYWDDTDLRTADRDCDTPTTDGTGGTNSTGGVHGWTCDTSANDGVGGSWGDYRYIDDWTYQTIDEHVDVDLPGKRPELKIEKTSNATDATRIGDTVDYSVKISNTGNTSYTADEPASFIDDLSGVLDDADYNKDATASRGTVDYDKPRLSWSGPLDPGESATVSYTVTLTGNGDTEIDNVAFVTDCTACDPPTPPADVCEETGQNPDTDLPCVPVTFDVPKLVVEKSADTTEIPEVGQTVTYTVVATNVGAGDYTSGAPAVVDDDLTDVLDDATVDEASIQASAGDTPSYIEPMISWSGALASGQSTTITYQVTYTGAGDSRLVNVAWAPNDPDDPEPPTCAPADENGLDPQTGEPCGRIVIPAADLQVTKSVDPDSGTTVEAGDTLDYTITFSNDGTAAADVDGWTDDLTGVQDDAEITSAPAASNDDLTVSELSDGRFTVDGTVPAGQSYTVTYSVAVQPDGERGDNVLDNFVLEPGEDTPPTDCADSNPLCTTNPVPEIDVVKSVDPQDGSTVTSGQQLTYTLTFTNSGAAAGKVNKVDDLSQLLDDAKITKAPQASDDALSVSAIKKQQFAVTGTLAAGQTVTITYQATVNGADSLGDTELANFVINPGDTPPADADDCADNDPTCTYNPAPKISDSKSVDPKDGTTVEAGQTLDYTLTFVNKGAAAGKVDRVDDLTHLLDDATIAAAPASSDSALSVSDVTNGRFSISGTLQPGQKVTVTYQATVKDQDQLGDTQVGNFLLDPDDDPPADPSDCAADDPDCTVNPVPDIIDTKSVDPATGSSVDPGQVLTYTLTFTNNGAGAGNIDRVDDLSHLTDDAKITKAPTASAKALSVSKIENDRFAITGKLKSGQSATVSYQATVNDADDLGDKILGNFLLNSDQQPPADPTDCVAADQDCTVNPVPDLIQAKTVDPKSGSTVQAGQTLTYTLSFTNIGKATAQLDKVDDLSAVLDDAAVTKDPVSSADSVSVSKIEDGRYSITGSVAAGQTVTVSYQVTVKDADDLGDAQLANFLLNPDDPTPGPQDCLAGDVDCTYNPVPHIVEAKSVDPETGSSVKPGQELTYTLTFSNVGMAAGKINMVDDLTHVLDDATVTTVPKASAKALSVSKIKNKRYAITGTLKSGKTVTVTYTVTVKKQHDLGDSELANFLLAPDDPTPADPVCNGGDHCTYNPVSSIDVVKSADPKSETEVVDGQQITYTLAFSNAGKANGKVDYTDHLAGVIDDAQLVGTPKSSDPALKVSGGDDRFRVRGTLSGGETVQVTYRVKVKAYADQGDHELDNFVTVTGQQPPNTCVPGSDLCTEHPTKAPTSPAGHHAPGDPQGTDDTPQGPGGALAETGSPFVIVPAALIGLASLGLGSWLLIRRRRGVTG